MFQAPAFGSLGVVVYKKASFAFVIVPTIVIGVIYANVSAKFVYFRVMGTSRHAHSNTVIGWGVWILIMIVVWLIAVTILVILLARWTISNFRGTVRFRRGYPQHG